MKFHKPGLSRKIFIPTAAALAVALIAASCSGGSDDAATPAPTTDAAVVVETTAAAETTTTITLPEQVAEEVAVAPAGVFVQVDEDNTASTPAAEGIETPPDGTTGVSPAEDEPASSRPALQPIEFQTTGADGVQFYVRLGATHPLTECLSYVDGNPALTRLEAATPDDAKQEITAIGQNCLGNPQAISATADPEAVAVGCLDRDSRISDCPAIGTPEPAAETPTTQTPSQPQRVANHWACGNRCDLLTPPPPAVQPTPGLTLSAEEIQNTPGLLWGLYPNPYLGGNVGTEENQAKIERAQLGTLADLSAWEGHTYQLTPIAFTGGNDPCAIVRAAERGETNHHTPESLERERQACALPRAWQVQEGFDLLLDLMATYEEAMAFNGYTIYSTCGADRFTQLTPDSSVLDFMHFGHDANGTPPQGLPLEWYFQQAAQAGYDYDHWLNYYAAHDQTAKALVLCQPLLDATETLIRTDAYNARLAHSGNPLMPDMAMASNWDHHIMAISDDRSVVVMADCYTGADREISYLEQHDYVYAYVWEDGHYEQGAAITPDEGNYQTCEEAAALIDASSGTPELLTDFLTRTSLSHTADSTYEYFPYGNYQYLGDGMISSWDK